MNELFNIHNVKPGDEDYPLVMELIPFKEKYHLISIDGIIVVPLFELIDTLSSVKPNIVLRNGVECCPTCMRPIDKKE